MTKSNAEMVAAAIRMIFAQPDAAHVAEQFEVIATMLARVHPKVAAMMAAMVSLNWSHREGQVLNGTLGADADRR